MYKKIWKFFTELMIEILVLTVGNQLMLDCGVGEGMFYATIYVVVFHITLVVFVISHNVIFRKRKAS